MKGTVLWGAYDKTQVFLKKGLAEADIIKTGAKLDSIKVSADAFGIKEADLPKNIQEIEAEKKQLDKQMDDADLKFRIQKDVNDLFTKPVSNWQTAKNDVIIKEKLSETTIGDVREQVKMAAESKWTELVDQYLTYAKAQVNRAAEIQKELDGMLKDGKVTEKATYEAYLNLVNSIAQVRNETLKEKFEKSATTISEQIGMGTVEEDTSTWSDTTDTTQSADEAVTDGQESTETQDNTETNTETEDGSYY